MRHVMDLRPEDTLFWLTDMGWMMGPWVVFGVLLNGATMVFYDGGPDYPDVDRIWALVAAPPRYPLGGIAHVDPQPQALW